MCVQILNDVDMWCSWQSNEEKIIFNMTECAFGVGLMAFAFDLCNKRGNQNYLSLSVGHAVKLPLYPHIQFHYSPG